jgi:hypothetical protein
MRQRSRLSHIWSWVAASVLLLVSATASDNKLPAPTEVQSAEFIGHRMASAFKVVDWRAGEPPGTDGVIYAVEPPKSDEGFLERFAKAVGVQGEVQRMPSDFVGAPGFWIKEPNPTNRLTWQSVFLSSLSGAVGYGSGEDNHKWDISSHRPTVRGIPTRDEALQKTVALLPVLGISEADLEHNADGTLRWASQTEGTSYIDREDGRRKRYVRQINVRLWQRVPGGSTLSVGGGGMLTAGFVGEGKLAEAQCLFRKFRPVRSAKPRSKKEIIDMLQKGDGRTYLETLPNSIAVTNCVVVYPQGNMSCRQEFLWPFYAVGGFAVEEDSTNAVNVYVPFNWQ